MRISDWSSDVCSSDLLNEGRLLYSGTPGDLTGRVDGRALRLFGPAQGRRALLERVLDREDVVDGTIQGGSIRLLMREGAAMPTPAALGAPASARIEAVAPRFEDAFIDLLGGGPSGISTLAAGERKSVG